MVSSVNLSAMSIKASRHRGEYIQIEFLSEVMHLECTKALCSLFFSPTVRRSPDKDGSFSILSVSGDVVLLIVCDGSGLVM